MTRYVCIHGHFYQPPREDPRTNCIAEQPSAFPFHDWNERVHAECYAPNTRTRVREGNWLTALANNFESISFNVGPTLLSWMETYRPDDYERIIAADRRAVSRTGFGLAMAQVYGHPILPLCNARDSKTQVAWACKDFELRFGRKAKGMWLPETAVSTEALLSLSQAGIEFTVLAPHQAAFVIDKNNVRTPVNADSVDTTQPYLVELPGGRSIVVFFYDGPSSRAVAFEKLLDDGAGFASRLLSRFGNGQLSEVGDDGLMHIATDGESYGHHHRFGDMALAYAISVLKSKSDVKLVGYEEYLAKHPPKLKAVVHENTAWSCAHGVGRWKENCGCNTGGADAGSQAWRGPLREALDLLRDAIAPLYQQKAGAWLADPWAARDDLRDILLPSLPQEPNGSLRAFLRTHLKPEHRGEAEGFSFFRREEGWPRLRKLLDIQVNTLFMYTSCGWFFDDIAGIEATQVLRYADSALRAAEDLGLDRSVREQFVSLLSLALSNNPEVGNGRRVLENIAREDISVPPEDWNTLVSSLRKDAHSLVQSYRKRPTLAHTDIECRTWGEIIQSLSPLTVPTRIESWFEQYEHGDREIDPADAANFVALLRDEGTAKMTAATLDRCVARLCYRESPSPQAFQIAAACVELALSAGVSADQFLESQDALLHRVASASSAVRKSAEPLFQALMVLEPPNGAASISGSLGSPSLAPNGKSVNPRPHD